MVLQVKARIFQPTRSAMQSGAANSKGWRLEYDPGAPRGIDPLMGWTTSSDTTQQLSLCFKTKQDAVAFARRNNLDFVLVEPNKQNVEPKSYAANFAHNRLS